MERSASAKTCSNGEMQMKRLIVVMLMLVATGEMALHAATVSDVAARQRYPWNGLVDIDYPSEGEKLFHMR